MEKPEKCMYPELRGGCEEKELLPVRWNEEIIGWLCSPHAMELAFKPKE